MQQQELIIKKELTQLAPAWLSFNLPDVDGLFPGFKADDFAMIFGSQLVTSLISKLCIRAQLPESLGGLESKIIIIDAANSSSIANFSPHENVISMRAYTAYRLTSLITEKLEQAVEKSGAKLVVISDIVGPFLSENVNDQEAKAVYSQIMSYLARFAKRHGIIIIATYLPHGSSARNNTLQEITSAKAKIALRFSKTLYTSEVELEKHPTYMLGVAEFNPDNKVADNYDLANRRNATPTLSYKIL